MTPRLLLAAAALVAALAAPGVAAAQSIAYAIPDGTTNMRAGPGFEYQVVAIIRPGSAVTVYGCIRDFSWCDSSVENIRGWVSTTRLEFQYGGNLVPVPRYYTYFDAPIVTFDFGYWDRYYYDEPWYRREHRHHRRHDYDPQRPRQSDGRPPRYSDGGGDTIQIPPEEGGGGGRQRDYRLRNGGGVTVFPEQGDGTPPARARDSGGQQGGGGGARCRASNPNCR